MQQHNLIQGSPEWMAHRTTTWNASDAPAMLGCSPYETRSDFLRRIATGITPEVDAGTQRRFDDGHRFEALARPLAEEIIGDDLAPLSGSIEVDGLSRPLGASFDGITMMGTDAFEHKTLGESLRYTPWDEGNGDHLPMHYRVQMEQQLTVSGAERVLFMATRWEGDSCVERRHCWYASDPKLRAQIQAGWKQFEADLAAWKPEPAAAPEPVGHAPETLPALRIEISGAVSASNLGEFKAIALQAIRSVNLELHTDQDFADADAAVKWCGEVESKVKAAKAHALSQTASIDELFRTLDDISAEARTVRLTLEKRVDTRKGELNIELVSAAKSAYAKHEDALRAETGAWIALPPPDFAGAIKGKRNFKSKQDALDALLASAKITADESARKIRASLAALDDEAKGFEHLFRDRLSFVGKPADDVRAIVRGRIAEHQAAEQRRAAELVEQERERIRKEEADRLEREQSAREEAEAAARAAQAQAAAPIPAAPAAAARGNPAPAAAAAPAIPAPIASPAPSKVISIARPAADDGKRLKLGDINARLAPIALTADGLAGLGFKNVAVDKAAKLYRESDFPLICARLIEHINAACDTRSLTEKQIEALERIYSKHFAG